MPNYFYVKHNGTGDGTTNGRYATKQTGSFATLGLANYYSSINAVYASPTPPVIGDEIRCSDLHDKTYSSTITIGHRDGVEHFSVDDGAMENYKKGAREGTNNIAHDTKLLYPTSCATRSKGIDYFSMNTVVINTAVSQISTIEDCTLSLSGTSGGDFIRLTDTADGSIINLKKVKFEFGHADQELNAVAASYIYIENCTTTGSVNNLIKVEGSGGAIIEIKDSNLLGMGATPTVVGGGSNPNDDIVDLKMFGCLVPDATKYVEDSVTNKNTLIDVHSIGFESDKNTREYFKRGAPYVGTTEIEKAIYKTTGAVYDKTENNYSHKFVTTANAGAYNPCRIKIYNKFFDTDKFTSTMNFKCNFAIDGSTTSLKDNEIGIEVEFQDGLDKALRNKITTLIESLVTPSDVTTETGLWTGLSGTNKQMSVNVSATIGALSGNISTGGVSVYLVLAKPSTTVYVDSAIEVT